MKAGEPGKVVKFIRDTNWRYVCLGLLCASVVANNMNYDSATPLALPFQKSLGLSATQFSSLYSAYTAPNIILPLLFGYVIDKFGASKSLIVVESLVLLGSIVFYRGVITKSYPTLLIGRIIFGLGGESVKTCTSTLEAVWFLGKEVTLAMSIDYSASNTAAFANDSIEPALYRRSGSIPETLIMSLVVASFSLITSLFVMWLDQARVNEEKRYGVRNEARNGYEPTAIKRFPYKYWMVLFGCTLILSSIDCFNNITSEFLQNRLGFSLQAAGTLTGTLPLICGMCVPFMGKLFSNSPYRVRYALCSAFCMFLSYGWLIYESSSMKEGVFLIICLGIFNAIVFSCLWPLIPLIITNTYLGVAYGCIISVQNALSTMVQLVIGTIIDHSPTRIHGYY
ncbi:MAG: MFS transporter, partial [bacterium]